ncbi:MAG: VOC family protein [Actinomycetota bacterium]
MSCRFTELIVDATDHAGLCRFWAQVLEWEVAEVKEKVAWLRPPTPSMPLIAFVPVPEEKKVKDRIHIDVSPTDRTRDEEVERLLALGATRCDVGQGPDVPWVVLADPEGNEFCVLAARAEQDHAKWPWPWME